MRALPMVAFLSAAVQRRCRVVRAISPLMIGPWFSMRTLLLPSACPEPELSPSHDRHVHVVGPGRGASDHSTRRAPAPGGRARTRGRGLPDATSRGNAASSNQDVIGTGVFHPARRARRHIRIIRRRRRGRAPSAPPRGPPPPQHKQKGKALGPDVAASTPALPESVPLRSDQLGAIAKPRPGSPGGKAMPAAVQESAAPGP